MQRGESSSPRLTRSGARDALESLAESERGGAAESALCSHSAAPLNKARPPDPAAEDGCDRCLRAGSTSLKQPHGLVQEGGSDVSRRPYHFWIPKELAESEH